MKTSETLRAALNLLKTKGWTKDYLARTEKGRPVGPHEESAACFCAYGACCAVTGQRVDRAHYALYAIAASRGFFSVAAYNDDPRCEFRHIRALFGKAIKMCEERGD